MDQTVLQQQRQKIHQLQMDAQELTQQIQRDIQETKELLAAQTDTTSADALLQKTP